MKLAERVFVVLCFAFVGMCFLFILNLQYEFLPDTETSADCTPREFSASNEAEETMKLLEHELIIIKMKAQADVLKIKVGAGSTP